MMKSFLDFGLQKMIKKTGHKMKTQKSAIDNIHVQYNEIGDQSKNTILTSFSQTRGGLNNTDILLGYQSHEHKKKN